MDKPTRIVILGAGFGGVYAYRLLHELYHHDPKVELVVVNERNYFLFAPLLHEVATGGQTQVNIVEPLRKVLCCLKDLYLGRAEKIDSEKRVVKTTAGDVSYDYLVVALGATTNFFGVKGAEQHSLTLKNMEDAEAIKNRAIQAVERASHLPECAERHELLHFVVVGGGPTGVELSAELADLFYGTFAGLYQSLNIRKQFKITLVHKGEELVPQFAPKVRKRALATLKRLGISVLLNTAVSEVREDGITLENGNVIACGTAIWTAGIRPQDIAVSDARIKNDRGRFMVNGYLQSAADERIFALGDIAEIIDAKTNGSAKGGQAVPQTAQAAVSEAEVVALNIARAMAGKKLKPFHYKKKGDLVSLGRWRAAGTIAGVSFSGRFAWWLWRTVYLFKLLSWQKKIKVATDWTLHLSSERDVSEL